MSRYTFPNVYAEELTKNEGPVRSASTGFGGMQAVTEKGPVAIPMRHRTFEAWKAVFGDREKPERGDAAYEAKLFFDEGGFELVTVRQAHFSNLKDATSFTGGIAGRSAQAAEVSETAAKVTTSVGPFRLLPGASFGLDVDNAGAQTIAFNAAPASVTDNTTYPVGDQAGKYIRLGVNGVMQTLTFVGVTTTLESVIAQINAGFSGVKAVEDAGQVKVITDKCGTAASISADPGDSDLTFDAPVAGTGDVANIDAVTAAEVKAQVEGATSAVATILASGAVEIASPTTGAASELDVLAGDALAGLGLSVGTVNGSDAGALYDVLRMEAGYHGLKSPGVAGNKLRARIVHRPRKASAGVGMDLAAAAGAGDDVLEVTSHAGITANAVLKVSEGGTVEYPTVRGLRTVVESGAVKFLVDLNEELVNAYTPGGTRIQTLEFDIQVYEGDALIETLAQNSMNEASDDFVEVKVNDENLGSRYIVVKKLSVPVGLGEDTPANEAAPVVFAGGTDETLGMTVADWVGDATGRTGLYAWDSVNEFMPFCTPNMNDTVVVNAAAQYAEKRMWMEYVTYVDNGMSAEDAISFRNNVIGVSSSYASMYAGGVKVHDPDGVGTNPQRELAGLGLALGLRARVDGIPSPNGGPWQAPAGEGDYGTSRTATSVATEYSNQNSGDMNSVGINVIRKFSRTTPVTAWGTRTLEVSADGRFRYIPTRRFFQFVQKSVVDSTRWSVFRNNDFRLWSRLEDVINSWLRGLMPDGAFPTPVKELAYFVKVGVNRGTMDAQSIDNGEVIGEIGLAPNKPGEFIIFRFSQFDSGWNVLEN